MKKILSVVMIFALLSGSVSVSAGTLDSVSEVIDFSQYNIINRLDCISYILLACGMSEHTDIDTASVMYGSVALNLRRNYKPTDPKMTWYEYMPYMKTGRFGLDAFTYLFIAQQLDIKLIYGESEADGIIYSDEYKPATAGEVLAFMVRLLDDGNKADLSDFEVIFDIAEKRGLVNFADEFYRFPTKPITPSDFSILLERFKNQPRYAYFEVKEDENFDDRILSVLKRDNTGSVTYREMLSERGFGDDYPSVSGIDVISVNDAISYVMKSVGTQKIKVYEIVDKSVSYWAEMWSNEYDFEVPINEFWKTSYFCTGTDYVQIAACDTDILSGKYYKYPDKPDFVDVIKYASAEDVIPIMVRCLNLPEQTDRTDVGKLMEIAEQRGLILKTDAFYSEPNRILTLDEFKIILERFLNQPRYLYTNGAKFLFDEDGSMTYGEYIYNIRDYLK